MARKAKSVREIRLQKNRLIRNLGGRYTLYSPNMQAIDSRNQARLDRVIAAAEKYETNIANTRSGKKAQIAWNGSINDSPNDFSTKAGKDYLKGIERKYSRSTYMGGNRG